MASKPSALLCKNKLRYLQHALGSRRRVAALLGVRIDRVRAALPVEDIDRLHGGQEVLIGKILAKRCARCGVTHELEYFRERQDTMSGCGGVCKACRKH